MRLRIKAGLAVAAGAVLAGAGLAACATAAAPSGGQRPVHRHHAKLVTVGPAPRPGSRAEATTLARSMFSRMDLPAGARRLPPAPVPVALRQPSLLGTTGPSIDPREIFQLPQPMSTAVSFFTAHAPAGMSRFSTGSLGGPAGVQFEEVSFTVRSVPSGVYQAQLTLSVAPEASGGSVLRADAQVFWYPPRSAAEYIEPLLYHVLTITVTAPFKKEPIARRAVTSPPAIARLADILDQSRVLPSLTVSCAGQGGANYELAFAAAEHQPPAIVVYASNPPCEGVRVLVRGRAQPSLQDATAISLADAVDRLLGVRPPT